jgi:hypothetical protein
MSQSDVVLLERTKGQYPISIATSLALESLMNIHPELTHEVAPFGQMNRFWLNVRTLHRNILGACPTDVVSEIDPKAVAEVMREEIEFIHQLFNETGRPINVQCYYSNYRNQEKRFPLATLRYDTTDKQKRATASELLAIDHLLKLLAPYQVKDHELIRLFESHLRSPYTAKAHTVFFTHLPIDLLDAPQFGTSYLIESHTGAYKPRGQWYTKFYKGRELPMIPFQSVFLQVFGDAYMFSPHNVKTRQAIIDVAEKFKWTPTSTSDLIRYSINQMKDQYLAKLLLSSMDSVMPGVGVV